MCSKNVLICRIVIIIVVAILPKTIVHVWFGGLNVSILYVVVVLVGRLKKNWAGRRSRIYVSVWPPQIRRPIKTDYIY